MTKQSNKLLMKNYEIHPTKSAPNHKVNAIIHDNYHNYGYVIDVVMDVAVERNVIITIIVVMVIIILATKGIGHVPIICLLI